MAPNPRIVKAFKAMKEFGISDDKVKPALKNLLKLYNKNWDLIEQENYRVLLDAIFETEEVEAHKKTSEDTRQIEASKEDAEMDDEPEQPLKRLRSRGQESHASASLNNSGSVAAGTSLKPSDAAEAEPPETSLQDHSQNKVDSTQPSVGDSIANAQPQPVSCQSPSRNKGKQPVSPRHLATQEKADSPQPVSAGRNNQSASRRTVSSPIHPMCLRDRGKQSLSPQVASKEKSSVPSHSSSPSYLEPNVETVVSLGKPQSPSNNAMNLDATEPVTDGTPDVEVPIAVTHPELSDKGNASNGKVPVIEQIDPKSAHSVETSNGIPTSSGNARTIPKLSEFPESSADLQISSSPFGEVKLFFNCGPALGKSGFRTPSLDRVLKLVEEKWLGSHKELDPSFSVAKVMKDVCEGFLELGTKSANGTQT